VGLFHSLEFNNRVGLHYFPDTIHYRTLDLETWLPELQKMGIGWLTLLAVVERAIPEDFIGGLLNSGINPVLHFQIPTKELLPSNKIRLLFSSYRRWGVQYAAFFDRPNSRANWNPADWAQPDLVERFLDLFIPVAEIAVEEGLIPIFPPLEPGGDYWDLSFLHSSLQSLERRGRNRLIDKLTLSAYAWIGQKPLNWGLGGPKSWPEVRPYHTTEGSEDQCGFRIFDWYLATAQRALGKDFPIILLRAGALPKDRLDPETGEPDYIKHAELNHAALQSLNLEPGNPQDVEGISDAVIACNFWLLASQGRGTLAEQAWFKSEGEKLPVVNGFYRHGAIREIIQQNLNVRKAPSILEHICLSSEMQNAKLPKNDSDIEGLSPEALPSDPSDVDKQSKSRSIDNHPLISIECEDFSSRDISDLHSTDPVEQKMTDRQTQISHYVLLPLYAWGAAEWDLSIIQPIIQETHPTIGFSLAEARLATRVTVLGGEGAISAEALDMLRMNGCKVDRVLDDGTLVAS
jgi:hypothetical protein